MSGVVAKMVGNGESADQVWFGGGCGGAAGAAACRSHLHHRMLGLGVEVIDRQKMAKVARTTTIVCKVKRFERFREHCCEIPHCGSGDFARSGLLRLATNRLRCVAVALSASYEAEG